MTTTIEAIYEDGKLILPRELSLPDKSHVRVTIESDPERAAWLQHSEAVLKKVWDNDADDVYNQLAVMTNGPQVRRELRFINDEFSAGESGGSGKHTRTA